MTDNVSDLRPSLKGAVQAHRNEAYQNGWADGYAEGYGKAESDVLRSAKSTAPLVCEHCDGTGDVHGTDGEWKGQCSCRDRLANAQADYDHLTAALADRDAALKLAHARAAERDQDCFRLEEELKGALELINAQNTNATALREMFGRAKERALNAEFAIAACARFLKEGETPVQRIERLHGEISGMMKTLAVYTDRALAAEAASLAKDQRIRELETEVARVRSDREYVIGFNAGWDEAAEQTLRFPTMLRKMWSGGEVQQWIDKQMAELRARSTSDDGINRCHVCRAPALNPDAALCISCSAAADRGEVVYSPDTGWRVRTGPALLAGCDVEVCAGQEGSRRASNQPRVTK